MDKKEQRELAIESWHHGARHGFNSEVHPDLETFLKSKGLSEELEVGKWYKYRCNKPFFVTRIHNSNVYGYGFNYNSEWRDEKMFHGDYNDDLKLATNEEVETALITEAKKRGFKEGVECETLNLTSTLPSGLHRKLIYNPCSIDTCTLRDGVNAVVFNNGEWATIIEPKPTQMTMSQLEKLTGIDKLEIVK